MATSESSEEVELAASVAPSQRQPPLILESKNATQQGASLPVLETSNTKQKKLSASETLVNGSPPQQRRGTTSNSGQPLEVQAAIIDDNSQTQGTTTASQHEPISQIVPYHESIPRVVQRTDGMATTPGTLLQGNLSIPEDRMSHQPSPPNTTGESSGTIHILSPALMAGNRGQPGPKVVLKDILIECSLRHHFNDELTLVIMRGDSFNSLRLTKISPMIWKAFENIEFDDNSSDIMLIVHLKDGGDEGFLTLSADEIYAMVCLEEDTAVKHVFAEVKKDSATVIKMTSTVASNSTVKPGAVNIEMRQISQLILDTIEEFEETGNINDIKQAISHFENGLSFVPLGDDIIPPMSAFLGHLYSNCFEHTDDIQDIDYAIFYYQRAVDTTPSCHANLPALLSNLGNSYLCRFERTSDLEDIDCAISHHQRAVDYTPSGHADLLSRLKNLGNSYAHRFERTGDLQDINSAISHQHRAVDSTPSGHVDLRNVLDHLGNSYLSRFEHTGNLQDIDYAISYHQKAVNSTPSSHADLPNVLDHLGNSYLRRFEHTGNIQEIDCAIAHHQKAVESTPSNHTNLPALFNNLGNSYSHRFGCTGVLLDIDFAIAHHHKAVESTSSGHTNLPSRFNNLGTSYARRFERTGNLQDIDCAISHHKRAVESTHSGHADLPNQFNNLGSLYTRRFEHTGDLQDIDYAISYHQKAVNSTPPGYADLPSSFSNLGSSYSRRSEHTGELQDIDCAISYHQKAVEFIPSGHADLPGLFNNLGSSYTRRFEHTRDLQDIDHAISYHQKAVNSTPSGHTDLPSWFNNLGNSYFHRFDHTGNVQDIHFAVSHHQKAVDYSPSDHADLPIRYDSLGTSYSRRFEATGDHQDIDSAISYHQIAVQSTPPGHADLPSRFSSLGISYLCRFQHTGDHQDIDSAISHHQIAIQSTPPGHASLPSKFKNLGNAYLYRFRRTLHFPDVVTTITSYRRGAESNGSPSTRLESAKNAAMLSSVHDRSRCLVDFALAINLLSEVAGLEQTIHRRYVNLHGHSDFVRSAVATAMDLNRFDLALEWLEQGRCLVWNQFNQLRKPIDDLRTMNPTLANQFITAASALDSYSSRSTLPRSSSNMTLAEEIRLQNATQNHTLHAAQYRQLLDEIRILPDFHDFLQPPKASDIFSSLPSDGPVIIFNLHGSRCDALALIAGIEEPLHIPLDSFSLEQAEQLQKTLRFDLLKQREVEDQDRLPGRVRPNLSSMSFVLEELWRKVVRPIVEALGYYSPINSSNRRRIWWCPTGPLAFLPLHAAGIYGSQYMPGSCISDFAVSSYTPTVQSLKDKVSPSYNDPNHTSILLINPNTPDLPAIPFTRTEIHDLKALVDQFDIDALLLEDASATTDAVKRELNTSSWVHFACHGIQDVGDPLKSGVHLHDGRLELLEIMRQKLLNPELAFLSACQTSKGDLKLSEEVVHLAAGMLAAGYRGVVGTMWSISDLHGPEFAKWFYQYLLEDKGSEVLDSTRASYALDYATRKVRESLGDSDAAFLTWVPYVHFGY